MRKQVQTIVAIFAVLCVLLSTTPAFAGVIFPHENAADTAIEIKAPATYSYIMCRGNDRKGNYFTDSEKWFKFKPAKSGWYSLRLSTTNTNRTLSLVIFEEKNGQPASEAIGSNISSNGANCAAYLSYELSAAKNYYVYCISSVYDYKVEPKASTVQHTLNIAAHQHVFMYNESSDGRSINETCAATGCDYIKSYGKIAQAYCSTTQYVYDGKAKTPKVVVKDNRGAVVSSNYYTIKYSAGRTKVGNYLATVSFKQPYAKYTGNDHKTTKKTSDINCTFKVLPRADEIVLSQTVYGYSGKTKNPSVTIKDNFGNTVSSSYYKVTMPSGRMNVGTYTVKVTFKSPYSGTKSTTFVINPIGTSLSSVTSASKGFTAKWAKKAVQVTGYQLQYALRSDFKDAKTKTYSGCSTVSGKITGLSAKKKYYVRVRSYKKAGGKNYYSVWSSTKSVKTK